MAVKAKATVTISHLIDISAVTRYYLLQSSTATAPAKPTTVPALIGKNLIPYPYNLYNSSNDGIAFKVASDGTITISGTSTATSGTTNFFLVTTGHPLHLNVGSKYTLSGFSSGTANCGIRLHQTNFATLYEINSTTKTISFDAKFETWYMWVFIKAGKTVNATFKPQLEAGTTATVYQKYVTPNWQLTEPAYTSGSTNTLYFVDCTEFTNGTFKYSDVSKSSSYEAAKEAYNKATAVETRVTKAETAIDQNKEAIALRATKTEVTNYVASRGENLVTNGTALLGDNTNFSSFTYDGAESYYSGGSFKVEGSSGSVRFTDEYIPVDMSQVYKLSYWIKSNSSTALYYDFIDMYDIDKKRIRASNVMYIAGSLTTLSQELKNGDTVVHLQSVAGFNKDLPSYWNHGLIFWNYKNSKGHQYGIETYSRNIYDSLWDDATAFDTENNTITLKTAWTRGTFPAGTAVSQSSDGGSYVYLNSDYKVASANTWTQKTGSLSGIGKNEETRKFREGTAFIRVGWLINYGNISSVTTHISTVSLTQNAGISDIDNVRDSVDAQGTTLTKTITDHVAALQTNADSISASVEKLQTTVTEDLDGLRDDISTIRNKVDLQLTEDEVNIQIDKKLQNGVNKVETSTGFKFDEDGLNISKSGSTTNTQITENGMSVNNTETGEEMLTANKDGVDAANLRATTYLIVGGRSRFENYGTNRTGCFWIGPSSDVSYPITNPTATASALAADNAELKEALQTISDELDTVT